VKARRIAVEFMLLFLESKGAPRGGPETFTAMGNLAVELASQKKLRRGAPLEDESAWVRVRDGEVFVSDGPFTEAKEVVGGFWIVDVADRAEAIEIARRAPHAEYGIVEVHRVRWRQSVPDPGEGTPFLFAFGMERGSKDTDGSKIREMLAFMERLKHSSQFLETAPLTDDPAARITARDGGITVTDGPFAETKEGIGGYALVRAATRADAIDLAKRCPHATWGSIEVREIQFFDKT
jgi:hypothetical protein